MQVPRPPPYRIVLANIFGILARFPRREPHHPRTLAGKQWALLSWGRIVTGANPGQARTARSAAACQG